MAVDESRRRRDPTTVRKVAAILGVAGLALVIAVLASNPLRRSEGSIERWLEKQTPLGISAAEVQAIAMKRGWCEHPAALCDRRILLDRSLDGSRRARSADARYFVRGELGSHQGLPWRGYVTAFWEFDGAERLVAVQAWKTWDTP